jgi:hypothetical protein
MQGLAVMGTFFVLDFDGEAAAITDGSRELDQLTDVSVDLLINPLGAAMATGTVGGRSASLRTTHSAKGVQGVILGFTLKAAVRQDDQVPQGENYVTTTNLTGSAGKASTDLDGTFTLGSEYLFKYGAVSGVTNGAPVKVLVVPNNSFNSTSAVTLDGQFGTSRISIVADVPTGADGSVSGRVGSKPFDLRIKTLAAPGKARLTGRYSGPADLLALIAGTVAYFTG